MYFVYNEYTEHIVHIIYNWVQFVQNKDKHKEKGNTVCIHRVQCTPCKTVDTLHTMYMMTALHTMFTWCRMKQGRTKGSP